MAVARSLADIRLETDDVVADRGPASVAVPRTAGGPDDAERLVANAAALLAVASLALEQHD